MKRLARSWPWLLTLAIPSFVPSLSVLARNPVGIPHLERLLAVSVCTWLLACALALLLQRGETTPIQSATVAFAATVLFYWGGSVTDSFGDVIGWLIVVALLVLLALLIARSNWDSSLKVGLVALAVTLLSGPIIDLADSVANFGDDVIEDGRDISGQMVEKPDVWLVVLDGHPGLPTMKADFDEETTSALQESLAASGLTIHQSIWTSYWITDYSLPSVVNMGYPADKPTSSAATKRSLYRMVSGDSRLTNFLDGNGYETYMVESGWSGSTCSSRFDNCVASHWMDEPMFFMLARSVVSDVLLSNLGYAFTAGARGTMDWALDNAESIAADGVPSYVFLHVLAPHPPFLLDRECEVVFTESRSGVTFNRVHTTEAEREAYLVEQMACLREFVSRLGDIVSGDSVLVVVSDHGTDRRNQLVVDPTEWSDEALVERMSVFLATSDSACEIDDSAVLPNVMRQALGCYTAGGIDDIAERVFIGPETELSPAEFGAIREIAPGD